MDVLNETHTIREFIGNINSFLLLLAGIQKILTVVDITVSLVGLTAVTVVNFFDFAI